DRGPQPRARSLGAPLRWPAPRWSSAADADRSVKVRRPGRDVSGSLRSPIMSCGRSRFRGRNAGVPSSRGRKRPGCGLWLLIDLHHGAYLILAQHRVMDFPGMLLYVTDELGLVPAPHLYAARTPHHLAHGGLLSGSSLTDPRPCEDPCRHPSGRVLRRSCINLAVWKSATLPSGSSSVVAWPLSAGVPSSARTTSRLDRDGASGRSSFSIAASPPGAATWRPRSGAMPCPMPGTTP
ncbi:MAG: hypothetical protein K0S78_3101, partial [Thermomicrobiales bacterium]|nr:hypothetical protein [Thermomicrobiales bacterium]